MNVWEGGGVRGKEIQGIKLYIRRSLRRIEGGLRVGKRREKNLRRGLTQGWREGGKLKELREIEQWRSDYERRMEGSKLWNSAIWIIGLWARGLGNPSIS